jgi:hypothetical protein
MSNKLPVLRRVWLMAGDKMVTLAVRNFCLLYTFGDFMWRRHVVFLSKTIWIFLGFRLLLGRHGSHLFTLPSCQPSGLVKQKIFNLTHRESKENLELAECPKVNNVQVQSDVILLTDQPAGVDLIEPDRQLDQLLNPTQIVDLTRFATFQSHWWLLVLHMLPPLFVKLLRSIPPKHCYFLLMYCSRTYLQC